MSTGKRKVGFWINDAIAAHLEELNGKWDDGKGAIVEAALDHFLSLSDAKQKKGLMAVHQRKVDAMYAEPQGKRTSGA